MKKILLCSLFFVFMFVPITVFAGHGDGIGKIGDGITGVIGPVFEDMGNSNFGPMGILGIPHGIVRGALSIPGSGGAMILDGVGDIGKGIIGFIPIIGEPIGGIFNWVVGDIAGGFLGFFGKTVGGFTSQMHPD